MKKLLEIFVISILILNMKIILVYSETTKIIEERLGELGVSEEYKNNIINYINDLDISSEEIDGILEESKDIFSNVKNKNGYEDFTFSELVNIYGKALNIAYELNIDINIDFSNKEIELIDKKSNLTLFSCNINDVQKYYENYKEQPITEAEYNQLISYISKSTDNDMNDNYVKDEKKSDLNKQENNDKNVELSENDDVKNDSNTILNKAATIKSKNINRSLSIIYIILFACVIFSILIGIMFKDKEENE